MFGLWLIPMGWFILATRRMPRALGWLLVVGYLLILGIRPSSTGTRD